MNDIQTLQPPKWISSNLLRRLRRDGYAYTSDILQAYAEGRLVNRDDINYKAATRRLVEWGPLAPDQYEMAATEVVLAAHDALPPDETLYQVWEYGMSKAVSDAIAMGMLVPATTLPVKKQTELVARFQPDGEPGWIARRIETQNDFANLWQDVESWAEDDTERTVGTITVDFMPTGYVESLPEFEGW